MSKEKQIEEMAHIVSDAIKTWVYKAPPISNPHFVAAAIYNAGYRKQSEGEWVVKWRSTFPQYEPSEYECSICGYKRTVLHNYCPNCGAKMIIESKYTEDNQ